MSPLLLLAARVCTGITYRLISSALRPNAGATPQVPGLLGQGVRWTTQYAGQTNGGKGRIFGGGPENGGWRRADGVRGGGNWFSHALEIWDFGRKPKGVPNSSQVQMDMDCAEVRAHQTNPQSVPPALLVRATSSYLRCQTPSQVHLRPASHHIEK